MNSAALSGLIKLANAIVDQPLIQKMTLDDSVMISIDLTIEEACECLEKLIPVNDQTFKMLTVAGVDQSGHKLRVIICRYNAKFSYVFQKVNM